MDRAFIYSDFEIKKNKLSFGLVSIYPFDDNFM